MIGCKFSGQWDCIEYNDWTNSDQSHTREMETPKKRSREAEPKKSKKIAFLESENDADAEKSSESDPEEEHEFDCYAFMKWAVESESEQTYTTQDFHALIQRAVAKGYPKEDYMTCLKSMLKSVVKRDYTDDEVIRLARVFEFDQTLRMMVQIGIAVEVSPGYYKLSGNDARYPFVISDDEEQH